MWTFTRVGDSWTSQAAAVPGRWLPSDWPYASAAVGAAGELYLVRSYDYEKSPEGGGELALATRSADRAGWRFTTRRTAYRYCYPWLVPAPSGLTVVATRAQLWWTLGYKRPHGAFPYVYDTVRAFGAAGGRGGALSAGTVIRHVAPTRRDRYVMASAAQPDVYRDSRGAIHVLYSLQGQSTHGRLEHRHAVLVGGRMIADSRLPATITYGKVLEDAYGRLFVMGAQAGATKFYVYPATSRTGTVLGRPTVLSLAGHQLDYPGFTRADPRSGTPRSDTVDLVFASGPIGQNWVHLQLRLP
jgi:hypothetical protein